MRRFYQAMSSLARNLWRDVLSADRPRMDFTKRLLKFGLTYEARLRARPIHFLTLFPEAKSLTLNLNEVRYTGSNVNPFELYCLCVTAVLRSASHIFEIGTFDGATTYQLALQCPKATIFTIDLGHSNIDGIQDFLVDSEVENVRANRIGLRYSGTAEAARIVQLYGDSTQYDYSPYLGRMDVVIVDACHEYDFVRSDTETALKLVRPGGIIVWHDYDSVWPGVVRAVHELLPRHDVCHINNTALAFLDTGHKCDGLCEGNSKHRGTQDHTR